MSGAALFHDEMRSAVRTLLLSLVKCASGPITGANTQGNAFTRNTGSFVADHFTMGDQIAVSGYTDQANNGIFYVRGVTPAALTVDRPLVAIAENFLSLDFASGSYGMISPVTFSCGLPSGIAWEDVRFSPVDGQPYIAESFRPITSIARGMGKGGLQAHTSSANFTVNYPTNFTARGAELMAGAMLDLFEPGTQLVYGSSSGTVTAAERKPLLPSADYTGVPVLITIVGYTARI
jgi:hypothetical protein